MSFYRNVLAVVAAAALISPVFAEDAVAPTSATPADTTMQQSADVAKVDLNKATAKDLMKVKGLNAAKARAIVAYRKKNGDFKTVEDLNNVKVLKKMKPEALAAVEGQLTVQ